MNRAKRDEWAIYVAVFACGTALMCLEITGSRVLAPFFGSTIFVWGSLIGVFMAALAGGYYLGGRLSDLKPDLRVLLALVAAAGLFILVMPAFEVGVCHSIQRARWGPRAGPLAASVVLFLVPSVLLGMVSPFAIRLSAKELAGVGNVAGRLYALSTVGSIVGTIGAAFWLIPALGTRQIVYGLGGVLVFMACAALIFSAGWKGRRRTEAVAGMIAILALGALAFGWTAALPASLLAAVCARLGRDRFREAAAASCVALVVGSMAYPVGPGAILTGAWEEKTPHTLVEWKDSTYHLILVTEQDHETREGRTRKRRLLRFNDRVESAIYIDKERNGELSYEDFESAVGYTSLLHLAKAFRPEAKNALFVGMGGGVVPTQFVAQYGMDVEIAEIDPAVEYFARKYFHLHPDVKVTIEDGREYLRRTKRKFDVIVLDAYSSGGQIPFHLTTVEFLKCVKAHLNPRGVVVSNLISALEGEQSGVYRAEYRTFYAAGFKNVYTFPKVKEDPGRGTTRVYRRRLINIIVVATQDERRLSKNDIVLKAEELVAGGAAIANLAELAADYRPQRYRPEEVVARMDDVPILTDDYAPVETLYFE